MGSASVLSMKWLAVLLSVPPNATNRSCSLSSTPPANDRAPGIEPNGGTLIHDVPYASDRMLVVPINCPAGLKPAKNKMRWRDGSNAHTGPYPPGWTAPGGCSCVHAGPLASDNCHVSVTA